MIPDQDDPTQPRYLEIRITDEGEAWAIDVKRNRVTAIDDDVCSLVSELRSVIEQLHSESHIAKDLAERLN